MGEGDSYTEEKVAGASAVMGEGDSYTEEKVAGASAVIIEGDSYTEEKVAGASAVINEGDSYTEEKVAGASAVINDGETYSSEEKMGSSNKRLKLSVTCDDLSLLSYSVLTTYNYMYTDCVKQDDIYEEQCFWMRQVIANSRSWLEQAGCDQGISESKLGQLFYDSRKYLLENNSRLMDNVNVYSKNLARENDEMLIETKTNGFTNEKHNTLHKNRKLLASMGGFFSGIVLIISCFVG